jgi:hypothetical protein
LCLSPEGGILLEENCVPLEAPFPRISPGYIQKKYTINEFISRRYPSENGHVSMQVHGDGFSANENRDSVNVSPERYNI